MQDLGVAALYHDCGYAAGRRRTHPRSPSRPTPSAGARLLMRQRGFHEAKTRRVLVALQHHQDANAKPRPGLFGRIVRIAEDYDTLSRRSGRLSPTMALAAMLQGGGHALRPGAPPAAHQLPSAPTRRGPFCVSRTGPSCASRRSCPRPRLLRQAPGALRAARRRLPRPARLATPRPEGRGEADAHAEIRGHRYLSHRQGLEISMVSPYLSNPETGRGGCRGARPRRSPWP